MHRAALFQVLFNAASAAGIPIETSRRITGLDRGADRLPTLLGERGWSAGPFDLIIDALGMRSPLWSYLGGGRRLDLKYGALWGTVPWPQDGFDRHALEQRYERASTMIGVLPIGRQQEQGIEQAALFWSLRVADYRAWLREGPTAWKGRIAGLWPETGPLLESIEEAGQMTLARYGHHMLARPFGERMVAIGDAFHAASPQLGQGANMALLDAQVLAHALSSMSDLQSALVLYGRRRRRQMVYYQVRAPDIRLKRRISAKPQHRINTTGISSC